MTKKEHVERNIGMTFDFTRHLIDCPEIIDTIPAGAELDFIDKDMPFKVKEHAKKKKVALWKAIYQFYEFLFWPSFIGMPFERTGAGMNADFYIGSDRSSQF